MKNQGGRLEMIVGLSAVLAATAMPARVTAGETPIVTGWPEASRNMALEMIERHGQPNKSDGQSMTWYGLYRGRRTVLHREAGTIEQVVLYRVPSDKISALMSFDGDIIVDREASELSVLADSENTNFLLLNLAHDIASGFITADAAKELYRSQTRRAEAGESLRYRSRILFEDPLPAAALR